MKYFAPFRFEAASGLLWRADELVPITRKASHVLACLIEHAGAFVDHERILQAVWPRTHVQPENVRVVVHELRRALSGISSDREFIRTAAGRGYAFVAPVTDAPAPADHAAADRISPFIVGRRREIATLTAALDRAVETRSPQIYLIEGDRGMGKTNLADVFVAAARTRGPVRISRGQALESTGVLETGGVLIDAIDLLLAQYPSAVSTALSKRAPSWSERFLRAATNASDNLWHGMFEANGSQRMIRELVAVVQELAREVPLLFILEDLHWGDAPSVECLRAIARHHDSAAVMVVATFATSGRSRIAQDLERLARELKSVHRGGLIRLALLTADDVFEYVSHELGVPAARELSASVMSATGGQPLLVEMAVRALRSDAGTGGAGDWADARVTAALDAVVAEGIACQIDALSPDDHIVLETAAVLGLSFTADAVAAGLECDRPEPIVRRLDALADRSVLIEVSEPRHRPSMERGYRFRHPSAVDRLSAPVSIDRQVAIIGRVRAKAGARRRTRP